MSEQVEGIVLHTKPFFESDKLVTVLFKDLGMINCLARRAATKKNPFQGRLEITNHNRFTLHQGKSFCYINSCEILTIFPAIREDYNRIQLSAYYIDLIRKVTLQHQPSPVLFTLLLDSLNHLCSENDIQKLQDLFQSKLLISEGILLPDMHLSTEEFILRFEAYTQSTVQLPSYI